MQVANIHEAKTQLSQLIERALAGEEVQIARAGTPLVRLEPLHQDMRPREGGQLRGQDLGRRGFRRSRSRNRKSFRRRIAVKLLLDTHVYLWWLEDPALLEDQARVAVANPRNHVFVSAVTICEIAIKQALGKLKVDGVPESKLADCRFHELPLGIAHAAVLRTLPSIHKDPFDRMLVAQAQVEKLTLLTRDPLQMRYDVATLAA